MCAKRNGHMAGNGGINRPCVPSGRATWQEKEGQTGHVCQAKVPHGREWRHKPTMCAKRKGHMAGNGGQTGHVCQTEAPHGREWGTNRPCVPNRSTTWQERRGGTKPKHRMAQGKGDKKAMCARHLAHMAGCKYVQGIKVYSLMLGSSRPRCFLRSTTLR